MMMLILTEMRDASQIHRADMREIIRKQEEMAQIHRAEMRDLIRKQEESAQVAKEQHRAEMRKQDQMIQMLKEDRDQHRAEMREMIQMLKEDREKHRIETRKLIRKQDEMAQMALKTIVETLERKVCTHQCSQILIPLQADPLDYAFMSITNTRLVRSLLTFLSGWGFYAPLQCGKISPPPPYSP
jgi:hypothetical protein